MRSRVGSPLIAALVCLTERISHFDSLSRLIRSFLRKTENKSDRSKNPEYAQRIEEGRPVAQQADFTHMELIPAKARVWMYNHRLQLPLTTIQTAGFGVRVL